ncbi:MAG TPA: glycoside hydrolase family 172 protein [Thermoleophilia bacterium]|nr:glycoside hydrolase family 172 protein [Thermoleophilia bacterium]
MPDLKGPTGWDTYRRLDELPYLTTGVQTKSFSSFDRNGQNDDYGGALRLPGGGCALADHTGPGEVDELWFTALGGDGTLLPQAFGDLKVVLDGRAVIDAPLSRVVDGSLGAPFVYPLVAGRTQSSGGMYIDVPMAFARSMRITTSVCPGKYMYYQVRYRQFADARGVTPFDPADPATDVLTTLQRAGTVSPIAPASAPDSGAREAAGTFSLAPGASATLAALPGPGEVGELALRIPQMAHRAPVPVTDDGRAFEPGGSSRFTVTLDPRNTGVRVIRRYDPASGAARAQVSANGVVVGAWRTDRAGAATGAAGRWSDQTLQIPAPITAGRGRLTVETRNTSPTAGFYEYDYTIEQRIDGIWRQADVVDVGPEHPYAEAAHHYAVDGATWSGVETNRYPAASAADDAALRGVRIRIAFDGERTVDSPLGEFFGAGGGLAEVRSLFAAVDPRPGGWLIAWWPMPFASDATVTLYNAGNARNARATSGQFAITYRRDARWAHALQQGLAGYFHATSHAGRTTPGSDWPFLRASGHGKFVGVSTLMTGPTDRRFLEGNDRSYADGLRSPQINGTGTEDFFQSGFYFLNGPVTNPITGEASQESGSGNCPAETACVAAYRLMPADAVAFDDSLAFTIEHGGRDDIAADYSSTAFWYGLPNRIGLRTDRLTVGNPASEHEHGYRCTDPGTVTILTSNYEGRDGRPIPVILTNRSTNAPVSFTLALDPANDGADLQRTADQAAAYQAAEVWVDGTDVGTWTEPLGNLGLRWLDDSYQLPPSITAGRSAIRVTLAPLPGSSPWNAARYSVISRVTQR